MLYLTGVSSEFEPRLEMDWFQPERYDLNQEGEVPQIRKCVRRGV